jgi:AcrR family transcriptional regulator
MKTTRGELDQQRRQQILDGALQCFLQFGYAKTSMDDVAKRANLSRPLIYLKFRSKQDLVRGVYFDLMESSLERAESILSSKVSAKARLSEVVEAINVTAWEKVVGHPMTREFYPAKMLRRIAIARDAAARVVADSARVYCNPS